MESETSSNETEIQPITESPENNLVDSLDRLFYRVGNVTHKSKTPGADQSHALIHGGRKLHVDRPLSHRNDRRRILKEIKSQQKYPRPDKQGIEALITEAQIKDEILAQYLDQKTLSVDMGDLGTQTVQMAKIDITNSSPEDDTHQVPLPIILLGGISNDLEPMQTLTEEIAFQGRPVITLGYPESTQGSVTEQFAEKIADEQNFSLHAEFFKKAIRVLKESGDVGDQFDLWGYSTGAPIAAEILHDSDFVQQVNSASLICPAGSVDQTRGQMRLGIYWHEARKTVWGYRRKFAGYGAVQPRKSEKDPNKDKVFNYLYDEILKSHDQVFFNARVAGGSIYVVSENQDQITKSFMANRQFTQNPQVKLIVGTGSHVSPLLSPGPLVSALLSENPPAEIQH